MNQSEGPWTIAFRRLAQDRAAIVAACVLLIVLLACALAPAYAHYIAGADPFRSNLDGTVSIDGHTLDILQAADNPLHLGSAPIGPTWHAAYFLGADGQGRDVASRLLYGGKNSLLIAGTATLICLTLAAAVGIMAGFLGAHPRYSMGISYLSPGDLALRGADQPGFENRPHHDRGG
jgi:peptide/nickel transport system permease protein